MGGAGGGSGGEVVSGVGTETGQSQREGRGKNVKQRACFFFLSLGFRLGKVCSAEQDGNLGQITT